MTNEELKKIIKAMLDKIQDKDKLVKIYTVIRNI